MMKAKVKEMTKKEIDELLEKISLRFRNNMHRHKKLDWGMVEARLNKNKVSLLALMQMEVTGGEPDVAEYDVKTERIVFYDFAKESPKARRSLCYDRAGLLSRKDYPPVDSAVDMATQMGVELMNEKQYMKLQSLESVDLKTSSWLLSPEHIRVLGGAIFGDCRYSRAFIYHNGAQSYYGSRGFRTVLSI